MDTIKNQPVVTGAPAVLRLRPDLSALNRRGPESLEIRHARHDLRSAWETAETWLTEPASLTVVDLDRLSRLLFVVFGLVPDQVEDMRIGDIFSLNSAGE